MKKGDVVRLINHEGCYIGLDMINMVTVEGGKMGTVLDEGPVACYIRLFDGRETQVYKRNLEVVQLIDNRAEFEPKYGSPKIDLFVEELDRMQAKAKEHDESMDDWWI